MPETAGNDSETADEAGVAGHCEAAASSRHRGSARRRSWSRARRSSTWSAPELVPPVRAPSRTSGDRVVLPGLVDTHVHINEPGRTEWEGFATATRAAAAGGITTLVDMPLNSSPVTTTAEALALKLEAARGKLWVDCGFYGGVVPGCAAQIGAADRRRRARLQGVPLPLGDRRVPERHRARPPRRHAGAGRRPACRSWSMPSWPARDAVEPGDACRVPKLRAASRVAAAGLGARRDPAHDRALPRVTAATSTSCTCRRPMPCR